MKVIKSGERFLLTQGRDEDYTINGIMEALADIDVDEARERFIIDNADIIAQNGYRNYHALLVQYLVDKGLARQIFITREWHFDGYSIRDIRDTSKLDIWTPDRD